MTRDDDEVTPMNPPFALCGLMFPDTTVREDVEIARQAGADGVSVDGHKLDGERPEEVAGLLRAAGLRAAMCVPYPMSWLPIEWDDAPREVEARVEQMCASIRRLAALEPSSLLCLTGPRGAFSEEEARRLSLEAIRAVADVAAEYDLPLAFEPFRYTEPSDWSIVFGLADTVRFLDEASRGNLRIAYDVWHLWDSSDDVLELTRRHAARVAGVHLSDYRQPTRSWIDRVLPGDGVIDLPAIFAALREGGFDGWYDLEVFSDDGRYGNDFPDSVWKLPPFEIARRGREGFLRAWEASFAPAAPA